jgi:AraC-like DNA-binding protein
MSTYTKPVPVHAIKTKEMGPLGFGVIDLLGNGGKAYDSTVPHRHTFFELLVFTQAQGNHEIDFNHYPVENNSVHFVSPGQIHKLSLKKNKGYVVCFTEDFISLESKRRFTESFPFYEDSSSPVMRLDSALAGHISSLVEAMNTELHSGTGGAADICRSYLNIVLLKLSTVFYETSKTQRRDISEKNQKVIQFKKRIEAHYLSHKSVSDYAEELNISPNHLNALCKKQEGKTATQLIQERLLLESKRLLYATDMHIKEISFYLQFDDVPYFNRFFKKQTGLTPIAYRAQFQKNR